MNLRTPITPAITSPLCTPIRMFTALPVRSRISASVSIISKAALQTATAWSSRSIGTPPASM